MRAYTEVSPMEAKHGGGRLRANRLFAAFWEWAVRHESKTVRKIRQKTLADARGWVLEIGCGTGANFAYYPAGTQIVATEPDSEMLKRAQRKVQELGLKNVELRQAAAEEIPYGDQGFDSVVSAWVFCHVDDALAALGEVRRLLKPGGTFIFMEHVRYDKSRFWRTAQDLLNPIWRRLLGAGCNVNRQTEQAIEDAGFHIQRLERVATGPLTSPTIYGVASVGPR